MRGLVQGEHDIVNHADHHLPYIIKQGGRGSSLLVWMWCVLSGMQNISSLNWGTFSEEARKGVPPQKHGWSVLHKICNLHTSVKVQIPLLKVTQVKVAHTKVKVLK